MSNDWTFTSENYKTRFDYSLAVFNRYTDTDANVSNFHFSTDNFAHMHRHTSCGSHDCADSAVLQPYLEQNCPIDSGSVMIDGATLKACSFLSRQLEASTVDPEIFALNILRLLIFRVVLFSSLEHTDEN